MFRYLAADIICYEKRTDFQSIAQENYFKKFENYSNSMIVSFKMMISKEKYQGIFLCQMEAIVFIILQIFFAMHAILKIGESFGHYLVSVM